MGVKLGSNRAAWWGAALLLCACTGGGGAPPAPVEDPDMDATTSPRPDAGRNDGGNRDGGGDGASEAGADSGGAEAGEAGALELGPLLELLEPEPDSVVTGSTVGVRCRAERNPDGELVNPSSVKVALYLDDEVTPFATQVARSTSEADVFNAEVSLAEAPHGAIRIECSADDVAQQKHHSNLSIDALVDRGPRITFLIPVEGSFVQADVSDGEDVRVRFKVEPQPLHADDPGAEIDEIDVAVGGKPFAAIEQSSTEEHVYSFGLDFGDKAMFTVVPDTLSVRVDARNARTPSAASSESIAVGVDGDGPTIVVRAPVGVGGAEPIVSGKVDVLLEIKDALAGVEPSTVEMTIGSRSYPVESLGNNLYASTFEIGEFPGTSDLTLNFIAYDKLAIQTTGSQGVRIDDQPPWLSLMPPLVRELVPRTEPTPDECSGAFDPLGDAPNDGQTVFKAMRLRALAWDRARQVSGQGLLHYSMVDQTSVDLVVQHDTSVPLLINSRGVAGAPCDAVNLQPAGGNAPVVIELDPMLPAGAAPVAGSLASEPNVTGLCVGKSGSPPAELCFNPEMTRIIKHAVPGAFPVVYGVNVTSSICTGDYYSNPTPGPLCMLAQARDNAGNASFSWPIRLCVEYADGEDNVVTCPSGVLDDVTCTDGCELPAAFGPNASDRMPTVLQQN
jgi:hypothetical protein